MTAFPSLSRFGFQVDEFVKRSSGGEAMTLCGNRLIYMLADLCRRQGRSGKKRSGLGNGNSAFEYLEMAHG